MATTTNKGIEKPTYQQYDTDPTGWTNPINANWDLIDTAFGGTYSPAALTSGSSDITLTATQCQNIRIKLTGTATTAKTINVFFPANIAGIFVVDNSTSGPFTINLKSAAAGAVEFVEAAQNANTFIWLSSDAGSEGVYLADNSPLTAGTGITVTGTTVALATPVSVANGGTGASTYTNGQLLIGNTAGGLTPATLTAGSNITITNGNGSITIGASGSAGGVTTFQTNLSGLTPSVGTAGAVTLSGTLGVSSGGTGATAASGARSNLGLGTMATQNSSSVAITGGYMNASTGFGSTQGFAFTSGGAGFHSDGSSSYLNFTSSDSIYNAGSTLTFATSGSTRITVDSTKFEIFMSDAYKPGGGSWLASSDSRLKKDVQPYTLSTADLNTLSPVSYQYNGLYGTKNNGKVYIGLVAQQVLTTPFAGMVGEYIYVDPDTKTSTVLYNVDSSQLVYALLNAVKDLSNRVAVLEAKVP